MFGVPGDSLGDVAGPEFGKGLSFSGVFLTHVLVEDVDLAGVAVEQCPQGSAGTHRSQLAVVADEDDLGPGDLAGGEEAKQGRVVGHPGLVEDDDTPARQVQGAVVKAPLQRCQGAALADARFPAEGAGRLP